VSNVLAVVEGRQLAHIPGLAEKHLDLLSAGLRGMIIGTGFVIVAAVAIVLSLRLAVLAVFALAFATFFLGIGISRLYQARALKKLETPNAGERPTATALSAGDPEYIKPKASIYQTEDLVTPRSVTEHTTKHLSIDVDAQERD
jgi:hypothetical protein